MMAHCPPVQARFDLPMLTRHCLALPLLLCAACQGPDLGLQAPAQLSFTEVFEGGRFPNVVVTRQGTVLCIWGREDFRARRSTDGGASFGPEIRIARPGFAGGGTIVDERSGDILAFAEAAHPPAAMHIYRSRDDGRSWSGAPLRVAPDRAGNTPSLHMNEHGITLRHGPHEGRLIRPSRFYAGENARQRWPLHYTNAIYSDDGGKTWQTSAPFPARGTGEATMVQLEDGRIYYNTRRHWAPEGEDPRRRWHAWSEDGGRSFAGMGICAALPDGPQDTDYGCMAGLCRLPIRGQDLLVYSNCDSPKGRHHGTAWLSFDGGVTWPLKRLITAGAFAYSSLCAGRPGTASEGWIYCNFEGAKGTSRLARFNLSWLLAGERTGDGTVPGRYAR